MSVYLSVCPLFAVPACLSACMPVRCAGMHVCLSAWTLCLHALCLRLRCASLLCLSVCLCVFLSVRSLRLIDHPSNRPCKGLHENKNRKTLQCRWQSNLLPWRPSHLRIKAFKISSLNNTLWKMFSGERYRMVCQSTYMHGMFMQCKL